MKVNGKDYPIYIYIVENKKCLKPPTRWGLSIISQVWFPAHPQIWQSAEELGTQNPIGVSQNSQFSLKVARSRGQNKPNDDLQEYFDLILQSD